MVHLSLARHASPPRPLQIHEALNVVLPDTVLAVELPRTEKGHTPLPNRVGTHVSASF